MKASALVSELSALMGKYGSDLGIVIQDPAAGEHPPLCKHGHFFVVVEAKNGSNDTGTEVVLRTWPY